MKIKLCLEIVVDEWQSGSKISNLAKQLEEGLTYGGFPLGFSKMSARVISIREVDDGKHN